MHDYDYLNARIKGMHSALLGREFYDQVLASQDSGALVDALLNSAYSSHLKDAIERDRSDSGIEWGLRRNLFDTFDTIRLLAPPKPRQLLGIQFRKWDIQNILTIVRGKNANMPPEDILPGIFPAGVLGEIELEELAEEDNSRNVADALTVWNFPFAFELKRVIQEHANDVNCTGLETEFMRIFFEWALNELSLKDHNQLLLRKHLQRQIDLINIKSALWAVSQKEIGISPDIVVPIPNGHLGRRLLGRIEQSSSLEMSFEILAESYFSRAVDKGILVFGEARRLATMERFLEVEIVEWGCRMFRTDPLGLGVPLGYIWRKYNEFQNLRIILRNMTFGMPAPAIREELFFVKGSNN